MAIVADSCLLIIVSDNIQIAFFEASFFQSGHSNVQTAIHAVISWLERGNLIAKAGLKKNGSEYEIFADLWGGCKMEVRVWGRCLWTLSIFSTLDGIDITGDIGMLQVESTA